MKMDAPETDIDKLLAKVDAGRALNPTELLAVGELLRKYCVEGQSETLSLDMIYSLLVMIGNISRYHPRDIVEYTLELKDPLVACLALEILCLKWNLVTDYLERVIDFALGVPWDHERDVQQTALKILGEYLAGAIGEPEKKPKQNWQKKQSRVFELLLSVFEDKTLDESIRTGAYIALCRGFGKSLELIPAECALLDVSDSSPEVDWEMVRSIRAQLKREQD